VSLRKLMKRGVVFLQLTIGVFLPWRLRCRYSALLLWLEAGKIDMIINGKNNTDYDFILSLGKGYIQEGKKRVATEHLNKALKIDPYNSKSKDIHVLLAKCYSATKEIDRSIEETINFYKKWKRQSI